MPGQAKSKKLSTYFILGIRFPNMSKVEKKQRAGYAEGTSSVTIEGTKEYKELADYYSKLDGSLELDIKTRITEAQKDSGVCVSNNLGVLQGIINDKKAKHRDRISAVKQATDVTGEKMPEIVVANINTDDALLNKLLGLDSPVPAGTEEEEEAA